MLALFFFMCAVQCATSQFRTILSKRDASINSSQLLCSMPGPLGAPGPAGYPGSAGQIGRMGFPGKDGKDGKDGESGDPGEKGSQGIPGNAGEPGPKGKQGPIGKAGARGDKGLQGDLGKSGTPGKKGSLGNKGAPGLQGICKCGIKQERSAFSVAITSSYPKERLPIKFGKILMNEGEHYNSSSGKFHCGIPGIYYFSYDITLANKHLAIGLVYNGQYQVKTFDANTGNHDIASGSTILHLKQGDEVWLQIFYSEQNGLFYDSYWADSLFTGFLIYPDQVVQNEMEEQ
ncbi:complement C1q tumor necrosis factor-related protein 2 [Protopterus annectens]|uniref:complement C1q tumor necrosis factor-related protein 2 n=1 Tax=Protopterus annectens TaxID=7888 RepID=UPI001CFBC56B|nr:complement C1q tumor necrosis factor-related protein 2 [Protopterus annectens]